MRTGQARTGWIGSHHCRRVPDPTRTRRTRRRPGDPKYPAPRSNRRSGCARHDAWPRYPDGWRTVARCLGPDQGRWDPCEHLSDLVMAIKGATGYIPEQRNGSVQIANRCGGWTGGSTGFLTGARRIAWGDSLL